MDNIKAWIKHHETFNPYPMLNDNKNVIIGFGHNLDAKGISYEMANFIFEKDFQECLDDLEHFKWYKNQPINVKHALINMCFSLGVTGLIGFKKMISYLLVNDYANAALEILDSNWAISNSARAKDVALMMRQGQSYGS